MMIIMVIIIMIIVIMIIVMSRSISSSRASSVMGSSSTVTFIPPHLNNIETILTNKLQNIDKLLTYYWQYCFNLLLIFLNQTKMLKNGELSVASSASHLFEFSTTNGLPPSWTRRVVELSNGSKRWERPPLCLPPLSLSTNSKHRSNPFTIRHIFE